jgi:hypothetical protein
MKKRYYGYIYLTFFSPFNLICQEATEPPVKKAPQETFIDVVIPACAKDTRTLDYAIEGIRKNIVGVRRIIVVSDKPYTDKAEWFDEKNYPFSTADLIDTIKTTILQGQPYKGRTGWLLQQLLKLYALFVIPNVSDNVLVIDSDTIFLNKVNFFDTEGNALYNVGTEYYKPYFIHAAKLIPPHGIKKVFSEYSGICHHMLFQKKAMQDLFTEIQSIYHMPLWQALLVNIDPAFLLKSCMSEYEIYFNYIFGRHYPVKIRMLRWKNCKWEPNIIQKTTAAGFHYISCHTWLKRGL